MHIVPGFIYKSHGLIQLQKVSTSCILILAFSLSPCLRRSEFVQKFLWKAHLVAPVWVWGLLNSGWNLNPTRFLLILYLCYLLIRVLSEANAVSGPPFDCTNQPTTWIVTFRTWEFREHNTSRSVTSIFILNKIIILTIVKKNTMKVLCYWRAQKQSQIPPLCTTPLNLYLNWSIA